MILRGTRGWGHQSRPQRHLPPFQLEHFLRLQPFFFAATSGQPLTAGRSQQRAIDAALDSPLDAAAMTTCARFGARVEPHPIAIDSLLRQKPAIPGRRHAGNARAVSLA